MYPPQLIVADAEDENGGDKAESLCSACRQCRAHREGCLVAVMCVAAVDAAPGGRVVECGGGGT